MSRRRLAALIIAVLAVTASVGTYIHDNPSGITPIVDINSGEVAMGENVTVKGKIIYIIVLLMGLNDQVVTVGDSQVNVTFWWSTSRVYVGWIIIARGTVYSNRELFHVQWLERVWLFV